MEEQVAVQPMAHAPQLPVPDLGDRRREPLESSRIHRRRELRPGTRAVGQGRVLFVS
jgi:hypothetical protein